MPSVEYRQLDLITETITREYTDPDTGETVTREIEQPKLPFEVRISKWFERDGDYYLHGFVKTTEFGYTLALQSNPWMWLNDAYTVADGLTKTMIGEMVNGIGAVENAQLGAILDFGNVSPIEATVESEGSDRFDFHIVLSSSETFDIDWLTVDFDPNKGGK